MKKFIQINPNSKEQKTDPDFDIQLQDQKRDDNNDDNNNNFINFNMREMKNQFDSKKMNEFNGKFMHQIIFLYFF